MPWIPDEPDPDFQCLIKLNIKRPGNKKTVQNWITLYTDEYDKFDTLDNVFIELTELIRNQSINVKFYVDKKNIKLKKYYETIEYDFTKEDTYEVPYIRNKYRITRNRKRKRNN